jgi:hypothetical protein
MGDWGYYAAQAYGEYCRGHFMTEAEMVLCINNATVLIPPINHNCPNTTSGDQTFDTMAMVCQFEAIYWTTYKQQLYSYEQLYIISRDTILAPETRPLLESSSNIKDKRATPILQSSTAHDLKNRSTHLSWSDDGNLVASTTGNTFSSLNAYFVGDTNNRLLHLYSDTMTSLGVSRLRLASLDAMPVGSVLVYVSLPPFSLLPLSHPLSNSSQTQLPVHV